MKYIIFNYKIPVIFPEELEHYNVVLLDKGIGGEILKPTSAGHLIIIPKIKENVGAILDSYFDIKIYGEAESIGLKPSENDLIIFEKYFNNYY